MSKHRKVHHLTIMTMKEFKLFPEDYFISEIIGPCSSHEEDFLLLKHTTIVVKIQCICKYFISSYSTISYFLFCYLFFLLLFSKIEEKIRQYLNVYKKYICYSCPYLYTLTLHHMSNSLNKVQLIGNLTSEPEVRETPNGQKVATFSIATNRKWKDAGGILQEDTEFHNCVAWR